jgi:hypothetical protein
MFVRMRKVGVPLGAVLQQMRLRCGSSSEDSRRLRAIEASLAELSPEGDETSAVSLDAILASFGFAAGELDHLDCSSRKHLDVSSLGFVSQEAMHAFEDKYHKLYEQRGCSTDHVLAEARNSGASATQLQYLKTLVTAWERMRALDARAEAKTADSLLHGESKLLFPGEKGEK